MYTDFTCTKPDNHVNNETFSAFVQRVIDNVPATIQHSLCQRLVDNMQGHLIDVLKLGEPDASQRFSDLLVEDPEMIAERERLQLLKGQLTDIQEKLSRF